MKPRPAWRRRRPGRMPAPPAVPPALTDAERAAYAAEAQARSAAMREIMASAPDQATGVRRLVQAGHMSPTTARALGVEL